MAELKPAYRLPYFLLTLGVHCLRFVDQYVDLRLLCKNRSGLVSFLYLWDLSLGSTVMRKRPRRREVPSWRGEADTKRHSQCRWCIGHVLTTSCHSKELVILVDFVYLKSRTLRMILIKVQSPEDVSQSQDHGIRTDENTDSWFAVHSYAYQVRRVQLET